jgi:adenosylhomocysteine nucleosidase
VAGIVPVAGIVCALAAEARALRPSTRPGGRCAVLADGSLLIVSGMGGAAAAAGARVLIAAGATALASFGLAGGLDASLRPGAICLPSEIVGIDGTSLATSAHWRARVESALLAHYPVASGKLLSTDRAIASVEEKSALHRSTAAIAVDMESLGIAQVASAHGLPFIAIRVIVDSATDNLPRAVAAAADQSGQLNVWRLLGALARTPAELAPLMRLGSRYRAASRSLSAVAAAGAWARQAF